MIAPTAGILRVPRRRGMVSANMVLPVLSVAGETGGEALVQDLLDKARLGWPLPPEEPVREQQAARVHQALRRAHPDKATELMRRAGQRAADVVLTYRVPPRSRRLLRSMPSPIAAWLFGRSARQHAWTFAGSGRFEIETTSRFALYDNPMIRGEAGTGGICHFHAALFEKLFQQLAHPRLICEETACAAAGAEACRFRLTVQPA